MNEIKGYGGGFFLRVKPPWDSVVNYQKFRFYLSNWE